MKNLKTESKNLEYKSQIPSNLTGLVRTCVAFADGSGGEIIIGVNDKGVVIGLNFVKVVFYFEKQKSLDFSLESLILNLFQKTHLLTVQEFLAHKKVSRNTVTSAFNNLIKTKKVRRHGAGRGVFYELKSASKNHL